MINPTKSFWLLWILATCISSAVGFALNPILSKFFDDYQFALWALTFLIMEGLIIGIGQWIILRTKLKKAWGWILATTVGLPSGIFLGGWATYRLFGAAFSNERELLAGFLISTIAGTVLGALQWLTLSRKPNRSLRWILVSAVSWGFGITVLSVAADFMIDNGIDFEYLDTPLMAILISVFTGTISGAFVESTLIQTESRKIDFPNHAS